VLVVGDATTVHCAVVFGSRIAVAAYACPTKASTISAANTIDSLTWCFIVALASLKDIRALNKEFEDLALAKYKCLVALAAIQQRAIHRICDQRPAHNPNWERNKQGPIKASAYRKSSNQLTSRCRAMEISPRIARVLKSGA
jgi:hypothetical protein